MQSEGLLTSPAQHNALQKRFLAQLRRRRAPGRSHELNRSTRQVHGRDQNKNAIGRFDRFRRFCRFVESISYVLSVPLQGSIPTRSTTNKQWHREIW